MEEEKKPWYNRWWVITLFVLIGVAFLNGINTKKTDNQIQPTPVQAKEEVVNTVNAFILYREYQNNEVRADELYRGKKIKVVGIVDKIETTFLGKITISLMTSDYRGSIMAYVQESEKEKVMRLNSGNGITLECVCSGKMMGYVVLDKCILRENNAQEDDENSQAVMDDNKNVQVKSDEDNSKQVKVIEKVWEGSVDARQRGSNNVSNTFVFVRNTKAYYSITDF